MESKIAVFWFRRDLRLEDNAGLQHALSAALPVLPVFIFDTDILNLLEDRFDRRVDYIHQAVTAMHAQLQQYGSALYTSYGKPLEVFKKIIREYPVHAVYCNRDYEPQAVDRDRSIRDYLRKNNIAFYDFKDHVIFERSEIVKSDGSPYTVYTPYAKKWKTTLKREHYAALPISFYNFYRTQPKEIPSLAAIGFQKTDMVFQQPNLDETVVASYDKYRDFPGYNRTTRLGVALRFGSISIRKCVAFAMLHNETWLSQLIWREFFMQILSHFPSVVTTSFKPQYDHIAWRNDEAEFHLWCTGKTGYPLVDAGMRQLNQTGFLHNRVRMVVASFLCKHLLIDWRWGEAYFAQKLVDYDLSANNGNWQWAAGSGCDAAPYFRIFNPTAQTLRFDQELQYIDTWNPTHAQEARPLIVSHEMARERALAVYRAALRHEEI